MIKEQLNGNPGSILSEAMATENLTFLYLAHSGALRVLSLHRTLGASLHLHLLFFFFFLWTGVFDSTVPGNLSILDNPDFS